MFKKHFILWYPSSTTRKIKTAALKFVKKKGAPLKSASSVSAAKASCCCLIIDANESELIASGVLGLNFLSRFFSAPQHL